VPAFQYFTLLLGLLPLMLSRVFRRPWNSDIVSAVILFGSHCFQEFEHVVVSSVVYMFKYFQKLSPGGVVVSAVVYMFQYFQELSPSGGVVVSAVIYRFQYLLELSPGGDVVLSAVVYRSQYLQALSPGLVLLYLLLFSCSNISRTLTWG
jgi:hypothetical protein